MELEILEKIGLSKGEIKIYNSILDLGSASINKIHEKTGIERRNIYDIINKLIDRGLVSCITENKKRFFQTTHPNKIIGYVEEKKQDLDKIKGELIKEIPRIIKKFQAKKPDIKAEIYRGKEGIKAVWEDMLNYKENYFIGSGRYAMKLMPNFWYNFNKRRIKLKVKWYNLLREEMKKEVKPEKYEFIKFLPEEFSVNTLVIFIYGNKVANVLWSPDFFAFLIESKEIAENYKKYHKYLWDNIAK